LTLKYDRLLSSCDFKFDLRHDTEACAALVDTEDGGKRLLVVAAALSSGKKVVALTYTGFADADGGKLSDPLAQLYEVTGGACPLVPLSARFRNTGSGTSLNESMHRLKERN
jgi:hypothetical protein